MTENGQPTAELRVLVLALTSKDMEVARSVFDKAGICSHGCRDLEEVCAQLESGGGAILLPEEAIHHEQKNRLLDWLAAQPPWSDLPVLVLARPGADSAAVAQAMELLGNVTVLERPMRVAALVSAVRSALRARQRQYQIREHIQVRESNEAALRESDQRKDEFLAMLAHELRNPLVPISNSLQILRLRDCDDSTMNRSVEMMERQVHHLVRLVDDLLDIQRITRGKIDLQKEPVDLADVVRHALETSRPLIEAGGHRLHVAIPPEPLTVEGDKVRLAQILANLLNNAAKYSNPGGEVALTIRREGRNASISVRDSGIGIRAHLLTRVFDLFEQTDRGRKHAQGGLGLGLSLVKRLVEMHGGTVRALSDGPDQGSEFVVSLPLSARPPVSPLSGFDTAPSPAATARRVLVVDDDREVAESLEMLLNLLGVEVHVVHDGVAALEAMKMHQPEVVLLDLGMPGMDGHEVARRIRQQHEFRAVTLVALTGWGREEDRRQSKLAGFDHHVTKPANLEVLKNLLTAVERHP